MLSSFLESLEKQNWPAWALLGWCFLVLFAFYPFALTGGLSEIVKHGIFVFGGIISLAYILLSVLYRPIVLRARVVLLSLFFITFVSCLSVFWSSRPLDAFAGLAFELDTLAILFSFAALVLAAAIAFKKWDWEHDLSSYFIHSIGIGFIIPAAVLHIAMGDLYFEYAFVSDLSLQVLAVTLLVIASHHLDLSVNARWNKKALSYAYGMCALFICFQGSLVIFPILGFIAGLFLIAVRLSNPVVALRLPVVTIATASFFLFLIFFSFVQNNQSATDTYLNNVNLTRKTLINSFQSDARSHLLGLGPHSFTYFWDTYRPQKSNVGAAWNTSYEEPYLYNEPKYSFGLIPTLIINTGILGLVSWLCFFVSLIYLSLRVIWLSPGKYDPLVPVALIILCLLCSMVLIVPEIELLALFAICVGILSTRAGNLLAFDVSYISYRKKSAFLALAVAGIAMLVVYSEMVISSSILFQKTLDLWAHDILETGNAPLYARKLVDMRERSEYYRVLAQIDFASAEKHLLATPTLSEEEAKAVKSLLSQSILAASKAAEINSEDYRNWLVLGNLHRFLFMLGAADAYTQAESHYNRAIQLSSIHPLPFYGLADLARLKGDTALALDTIERVLSRRPDWQEAVTFKEELMSDTVLSDEVE